MVWTSMVLMATAIFGELRSSGLQRILMTLREYPICSMSLSVGIVWNQFYLL